MQWRSTNLACALGYKQSTEGKNAKKTIATTYPDEEAHMNVGTSPTVPDYTITTPQESIFFLFFFCHLFGAPPCK